MISNRRCLKRKFRSRLADHDLFQASLFLRLTLIRASEIRPLRFCNPRLMSYKLQGHFKRFPSNELELCKINVQF